MRPHEFETTGIICRNTFTPATEPAVHHLSYDDMGSWVRVTCSGCTDGWARLIEPGHSYSDLIRLERMHTGMPAEHLVHCRGCNHTWTDPYDCLCTCSDPASPQYEDWVTDPLQMPGGGSA